MVEGKRERVYVYFDKDMKTWLKEQAQTKQMSLSKYIHDVVQKEYDNDIKLDLDFNGGTNV